MYLAHVMKTVDFERLLCSSRPTYNTNATHNREPSDRHDLQAGRQGKDLKAGYKYHLCMTLVESASKRRNDLMVQECYSC